MLSSYFYRVLSTISPIRVPFRVLIGLLTTYLLSPPTLQVGFRDAASGFSSANLSNVEFKVLGLGLGVKIHNFLFPQKAQYPLITEYTLNCRGFNIMI